MATKFKIEDLRKCSHHWKVGNKSLMLDKIRMESEIFGLRVSIPQLKVTNVFFKKNNSEGTGEVRGVLCCNFFLIFSWSIEQMSRGFLERRGNDHF